MLFETDVPIPPPYHGGATKTAYPFSRLAPGQSVLWPCTDKKARHPERVEAVSTGGGFDLFDVRGGVRIGFKASKQVFHVVAGFALR